MSPAGSMLTMSAIMFRDWPHCVQDALAMAMAMAKLDMVAKISSEPGKLGKLAIAVRSV